MALRNSVGDRVSVLDDREFETRHSFAHNFDMNSGSDSAAPIKAFVAEQPRRGHVQRLVCAGRMAVEQRCPL
jgi:hypothetical protein